LDSEDWVNLTNILRAAFLYKSFARSFFVLEVKVKLFIGAKKMVQLRSRKVGEIDSRSIYVSALQLLFFD
jgi:hypothetical protein